MYRRALLPTDGSDLSDAAIEHVARVATSAVVFQVPLDVADLFAHSPGDPVDVEEGLADRWRQSEEAKVRANLERVAKRLSDAGLTDIRTVMGEGYPGDAILRTARDQGCDVVVMSTHGRTGVRRLMLGSVASYVANHAEGIPVLLVRA